MITQWNTIEKITVRLPKDDEAAKITMQNIVDQSSRQDSLE